MANIRKKSFTQGQLGNQENNKEYKLFIPIEDGMRHLYEKLDEILQELKDLNKL